MNIALDVSQFLLYAGGGLIAVLIWVLRWAALGIFTRLDRIDVKQETANALYHELDTRVAVVEGHLGLTRRSRATDTK